MSDGSAAVVGDVLRVLVVGDSGPVDDAMAALSSQFESVSLVRERTRSSALERLAQLDIHCVVCPLETTDGDAEGLARFRDRDAALPIVAVTRDATADPEAVDRALAAGATDVVGTDEPRPLIAARVRNAAERYRLASASDRGDRSVLERSDALVWVVDGDGTVEYASSAVERRMGYTPDELERTPLAQLVHPDDRTAAAETIDAVAGAAVGSTERVSLRLGHGDGTWHAYELTATNRLADPLVEGIVLTLSPASVADSDAVRPALDRLEDPLFALGPQWELRYANAAAGRLFADDPTPGTVVWDLLDEAVRGQFYERLLEARTTDEVVSFETTPPSLETRLAVTAHPGAEGVTVHAREAPDAAAVDRDRFDLLEETVDALEDGIAVLEGSTVRFANAALFELADAETLAGRDVAAVFDDDLAAAVRERARTPVVRWMEPLSGDLVAGDDRRTVDVFVTPLPTADRTLCVVRDRRRSGAAALSTLGEAVGDLRAAESLPAVRRTALDAVLAATGAELAGWYLVDETVLRPAAVETVRPGDPVELPPIERDGIDLVDRLETDGDGAPVVFDRSELEAVLSRAGIRAERVLAAPVADGGVVLATSTDPTAFGSLERATLGVVAGAAATAIEAVERDSAARARRTDLERLEAVVDRCRRLRELERSLLEADGRGEVERRLCEGFVSVPVVESPGTIELAWIGDVGAGSDRITPGTWAGQDGEFLDSISVPADADGSDHPTARAARTLESAVVDDVGRDDADADRAWRRRALERGFRSVLSVPLVADEFCYGTLTLYADRPSAFDDDTRAACEHLAAVAGHAIAALERKRALLSERVTELEIVLREDRDPLSSIAHRLDRRLDVQAIVPRSASGSAVFCTVSDVDEEAVDDVVASLSPVESGRLVGDRADESLLEFVLTESSVAETLAAHGGVLRSVTPVDDRTRLVIDLSSTVDVRSFVRMVERRHPGAELVARRERDRSARPGRAFEAELRDRLSERQLRTLETAYYSGFFEWPRESTGEAVADSLGVSQPTFSRHLRIAQRKLFALLFEERDVTEGE